MNNGKQGNFQRVQFKIRTKKNITLNYKYNRSLRFNKINQLNEIDKNKIK